MAKKSQDKLTFDVVGNWSELKLEILREYSSAYQTILAGQKQVSFSTIYIDAFAGAGLHVSRDSGEVIDGSPRIVASTVPRFSEIHLIDLDGARVSNLQKMFANDIRVKVYQGDCNIELAKIIPTVNFSEYKRALCLLDPYGLNLNWESIAMAGQMDTIDLINNFPVADMNRNVFWRNHKGVDASDIERMNRFWGDDSWKELVWSQVPNLFGDDDWMEKTGSNNTIAEGFRKRLETLAGFKCVPEPLAMKNSKGATVYYLYFASQKDVARKVANHLFKKAKGRMQDGNEFKH